MDITSLVLGELETNCYIVTQDKHPADAVIIDPADEAETIIAALKRNKLIPRYILLTHGHYDHCAALPELYRYYGQKPIIAIAEADKHYLGADAFKAHYDCFKAAGYVQFVERIKTAPLPEPTLILHEGDTIAGLSCLLTPGHTEGSCVFFNEYERALFSGDTLFFAGRGRTDLPGGDERKLDASLKRLFALREEVCVYPGHGGITFIRDESH